VKLQYKVFTDLTQKLRAIAKAIAHFFKNYSVGSVVGGKAHRGIWEARHTGG